MPESEKTFQADAVAPADGDSAPVPGVSVPVAVALGVAPAVADADDPAASVGLPDELLPAVHAGAPLPSPLQPDIAAATTISAVPNRILRATAFRTMRQA
ncbi:hypothetical protein [Arthrobacter sp. 24S4-2]|uniref:hypothetical protein n=1 Tax=Arthrobacter sp. 24S4-2 TaxID=2575374 RepID=UPI0034A0B23B